MCGWLRSTRGERRHFEHHHADELYRLEVIPIVTVVLVGALRSR